MYFAPAKVELTFDCVLYTSVLHVACDHDLHEQLDAMPPGCHACESEDVAGHAAAKREPKPEVDKKPAKKAKAAPAKAAKASNVKAEKQHEPSEVVVAEAEGAVSDPPEQAPAAAEVMSDRSNHQEVTTREHPEYGMPPHPDAEITVVGSKAFWEYIDDKGAEVSVVCLWSTYFVTLCARAVLEHCWRAGGHCKACKGE